MRRKRQYFYQCKYCKFNIRGLHTPICGLCANDIINGGRLYPQLLKLKNEGYDMSLKIEFIPYRFEDTNDTLSGLFEGVVTEPWPALILNDNEAIYGIGLTYQIIEFLKLSKLPAKQGVKMTLQFLGKTKTNSGTQVSKFKITVDESTLPKSYNKEQLKPKVLDPASDEIDWEALYTREALKPSKPSQKRNKKSEPDDLPF